MLHNLRGLSLISCQETFYPLISNILQQAQIRKTYIMDKSPYCQQWFYLRCLGSTEKLQSAKFSDLKFEQEDLYL